jgi:hypothetical protein
MRARPHGTASRMASITAARSPAASTKRRPAPHNGSSSRLLTRTPTAFPPASTVPTTNAASAVASRSKCISEPYEP